MSRERIEFIAKNDQLAHFLGLEILSFEPLLLGMTIKEQHLNALKATHGGTLFSLADCAFAMASNAAGADAVAIDIHMSFMRPTKLGDKITASVVEVSRTRRLGIYRVEIKDSQERIIASFTGTAMVIGS